MKYKKFSYLKFKKILFIYMSKRKLYIYICIYNIDLEKFFYDMSISVSA